uniref:Type II secretion system protein K n=1 Tax=Candidatus Kentrum sp. UNK TaxID=2126344 RepID=A0A451AIH4_9GAMM|nr:MAG: general secretion pathway protein K [Candidatus Kentron sp. UNK]VFK71579.1 MAG: general secretion pathway protein K [Candidatus Kentron sp. UNK]
MRRDRGIALISVILTVALIATISTGMIARQYVEIRRTSNLIHAHQAFEYALGVESWATRLLRRDLLEKEENNTDHPGEAWASALPPTDIAGGMLTGRIEDLQARFNLNNLRRSPPDPKKPGEEEVWRDLARFQELLKRCELEAHLAWPVVDWIDGGDRDETSPGGAEDYAYLGLDVPYRAANAPMASPDELVLTRGFDYDAYACLSPFVSALPEYVPINVNTASGPVLMASIIGMTEAQAERIIRRRETEPYRSVDDFTEYLKAIGAPAPDAKGASDKGSFSVSSDYYLVVASARIGNIRMDLFSRVKRLADGKIRVLSRRWGNF